MTTCEFWMNNVDEGEGKREDRCWFLSISTINTDCFVFVAATLLFTGRCVKCKCERQHNTTAQLTYYACYKFFSNVCVRCAGHREVIVLFCVLNLTPNTMKMGLGSKFDSIVKKFLNGGICVQFSKRMNRNDLNGMNWIEWVENWANNANKIGRRMNVRKIGEKICCRLMMTMAR